MTVKGCANVASAEEAGGAEKSARVTRNLRPIAYELTILLCIRSTRLSAMHASLTQLRHADGVPPPTPIRTAPINGVNLGLENEWS